MTSLWLYGEILVFLKYTPNSLTKLCQVFIRLVCKHIESNSLKPWGFHAIKLRKLRPLSVASKSHFRNDRAIVSHLKKKKKTDKQEKTVSAYLLCDRHTAAAGRWLASKSGSLGSKLDFVIFNCWVFHKTCRYFWVLGESSIKISNNNFKLIGLFWQWNEITYKRWLANNRHLISANTLHQLSQLIHSVTQWTRYY